MEAARRAEMRERVDALLQRGAFFDAAVFAFGHCDATEETIDYLIEKGVAVRGILDNNKAKHGLAYRGVPISPPAVAAECGDAGIVLIATRFFEPMAAQLREMGYGGEIVRAADYNSFAEYSLSDETLGRMTARVERGAATLGRMRRRYPSHYLIVCPSNALGDVYWAMAFLPAYREKEKIGDFAIVVVGGGCRQVAEMFGAKDIVVLDGAEMDELVQALIFTREGNCLIAHHDRPYTDNIIRWLDRRFLSFIDYYRRAVYGLPQDAPPAAPVRVEPWPNADGIPEGKSVVIAPYAKSVARPETGFWEMLAREYAREGLTPCTVVNGGETPIDGTVPLRVPLNQLLSAVELAGRFVGLRSGLCDVAHTARCRKAVVFPDCFYSTTPHKVEDFFALPGWGRVMPKTNRAHPHRPPSPHIDFPPDIY